MSCCGNKREELMLQLSSITPTTAPTQALLQPLRPQKCGTMYYLNIPAKRH